jgi:hypothetical protein
VIERQVTPDLGQIARQRFKRDHAPAFANQARETERIEAGVRPDITNRHAGSNQSA